VSGTINSLIERLCDGDRHDPQERAQYTVADVEKLAEESDSEEQKEASLLKERAQKGNLQRQYTAAAAALARGRTGWTY
jgi:hypothetical protein